MNGQGTLLLSRGSLLWAEVRLNYCQRLSRLTVGRSNISKLYHFRFVRLSVLKVLCSESIVPVIASSQGLDRLFLRCSRIERRHAIVALLPILYLILLIILTAVI